ncbi:unnamed protein product [Victoria cruziana]
MDVMRAFCGDAPSALFVSPSTFTSRRLGSAGMASSSYGSPPPSSTSSLSTENHRHIRAATPSDSVSLREVGGKRVGGVGGDSFIRPHLKRLSSYQPILPFEVLSSHLGRKPEDIIKLDANENPYGPPPEVLEALATMKFPYIYPDPESRRLCAALSEDSGLDADYILAGCGADELIDLIMRCVLDPGDKIVDCPPTFTMYEFDAAVNAALVIKGLAGLRVGYGAFPLSIIEYLRRAKQPYNVSVAAEVAARAALSNPGYLEKVKQALVAERERLYKLLCEVPFLKPYPSYSNFILCEVTGGRDAKKLKVFAEALPVNKLLHTYIALSSCLASCFIMDDCLYEVPNLDFHLKCMIQSEDNY